MCDWLGSQPLIADPGETSFVTRVGAAELAASSAGCPWLVRARRGQRLNLTVHFAASADGGGGGGSLCGVVIDVVDGGRTTTLEPPCQRGSDASHRQRLTYTSVGNQLEVYVRSTDGATYAAAAAPATAASTDYDDVDDDDDDDGLSSATSPGFLLHYQGLLPPLVSCFKYCDKCVSVCLSVCLPVHEYISITTPPNVSAFSEHVAYGRSSVFH